MASPVLQLKRSTTPGRTPSTTDLLQGELAINVYDGKLFLKKTGGGDSIIDVTNPSNFALAGTTGFVQFAGTTSLNSSANFYWNNSLNRLGLLTTNPQATLDIGTDGYINISSTSKLSIAGSTGATGTFLRTTSTGTEWAEPSRIVNGTTSVTADATSVVTQISSTTVQTINSAGVTVSGNISATNVTATQNVTAQEYYQSTTSGTVNYTSKMMAMMIATGL
jgi:hypothetical protein